MIHQLYKNCKVHADYIIDTIQKQENFLFGYNILKDKYTENMIKEGIIDSFQTIKTAIEDAVSVGGLLMTTECLISKEIDYNRKIFNKSAPPVEHFKNKFRKDASLMRKGEEDFLSEDKNDDKII